MSPALRSQVAFSRVPTASEAGPNHEISCGLTVWRIEVNFGFSKTVFGSVYLLGSQYLSTHLANVRSVDSSAPPLASPVSTTFRRFSRVARSLRLEEKVSCGSKLRPHGQGRTRRFHLRVLR